MRRLAPICLALHFTACSYGNFWLPTDDALDQPMPDAFAVELGPDRTLYRIAPADRSGFENSFQRRFGLRLESYGGSAGVGRALAVRPPNLWVIPKPGGLFSGAETEGIIEFNYRDRVGSRMTEFNSDLPDGSIRQIFLGPEGRLWIGGDGGAAVYDPEIRRVDKFDDWNTFDQEGGGLSGSFLGFGYTPTVGSLAVGEDLAYFGAGKLFQYNMRERSWRGIYPKILDTAQPIVKKRRKTKESIVIEWKDKQDRKRKKKYPYVVKRVTVIQPHHVLPTEEGFIDSSIERLEPTSLGLWALSRHGVSLTYDQGAHWLNFMRGHEDWWSNEACSKRKKIGPKEKRKEVCVEYVTTLTGMIYQDSGHKLPGVSATCAREIAPGEVWIAFSPLSGARAMRGGVVRYKEGKFTPIGGDSFSGQNVIEIRPEGDRVWVATDSALYLGDRTGESFQPFPLWTDEELRANQLLGLEIADGALWIATDVGVLRIDREAPN